MLYEALKDYKHYYVGFYWGMKIIRFWGGLGNQMFQYAFYKAMEKRYPNVKADLSCYDFDKSHNGYELDRIFNFNVN